MTVKNALPSLTPVGAEGGPTRSPATNVPSGVETDETALTCESCVAYRTPSAVLISEASRRTMVTFVLRLSAKTVRS